MSTILVFVVALLSCSCYCVVPTLRSSLIGFEPDHHTALVPHKAEFIGSVELLFWLSPLSCNQSIVFVVEFGVAPLELHPWNLLLVSSLVCSVLYWSYFYFVLPCPWPGPLGLSGHHCCTFTRLHRYCWHQSKANGPSAVWPHGVPHPGIIDSTVCRWRWMLCLSFLFASGEVDDKDEWLGGGVEV